MLNYMDKESTEIHIKQMIQYTAILANIQNGEFTFEMSQIF